MRVVSSLTSTGKLARFSACAALLKVSFRRLVQAAFHQAGEGAFALRLATVTPATSKSLERMPVSAPGSERVTLSASMEPSVSRSAVSVVQTTGLAPSLVAAKVWAGAALATAAGDRER